MFPRPTAEPAVARTIPILDIKRPRDFSMLYYSELMQENDKYQYRTDETNHKGKHMQMGCLDRSPVAHLIAYNLTIHIPSDKQTGEEGTYRQTTVGGEPIEEIKEVHAKEREPAALTHRQRTESSKYNTIARYYTCCVLSMNMQLLS